MLYMATRIIGAAIVASDGEIGGVADLLFDDARWTIRWAVVETGGWLCGRQVLLPQSCFGAPTEEGRRLPVSLTRQQVEESPASESADRLSRRYEEDLLAHYALLPYWYGSFGGDSFLTAGVTRPPAPPLVTPAEAAGNKPGAAASEDNLHLHSLCEVTGSRIHASDGEIGHVEDFLIEEGSWAIRYLIADTRNWLPGKRVLVSPRWLRGTLGGNGGVEIALTRRQIKDSPAWDPESAVERSYEERLHDYYDLPGYW